MVVSLVVIALLTCGVGLTSAYFDKLVGNKIEEPEVLPTPTITPIVTVTPSPTTKVLEERILAKKKVEATNSDGGGFDCVGPDGKVFKSNESDCKKLNESWGKTMDYMMNSGDCNGGTVYIKKSEFDKAVCCSIGDKKYFYYSSSKCNEDRKAGVASNTNVYVRPNIQPWDGKISCSYSGGGYYYDFGKLTYADCLVRSDQYWNEQSKKTQTTTPTTKVVTQTDIDNCKATVRSEVSSLVNGCYIKFQGSAAEGCEQTYRDRGATQTQNCITYGTSTPLTDTMPVPTQKCYATWEEYYAAHPYGAPVTGTWHYEGTPPCD